MKFLLNFCAFSIWRSFTPRLNSYASITTATDRDAEEKLTVVKENVVSYSDTSDALKIVNMSNVKVGVSMEVKMSAALPSAITVASSAAGVESDSDGKGSKSPAVYLALTGGSKTEALAAGTDGKLTAKITDEIGAPAANTYKVAYDASKTPKYFWQAQNNDPENTAWSSIEFQMTGKANSLTDAEGWRKIVGAPVSLNVVWKCFDPTPAADTGTDDSGSGGSGDSGSGSGGATEPSAPTNVNPTLSATTLAAGTSATITVADAGTPATTITSVTKGGTSIGTVATDGLGWTFSGGRSNKLASGDTLVVTFASGYTIDVTVS